MKYSLSFLQTTALFLFILNLGCRPVVKTDQSQSDWCDRVLRPQLSQLTEIKTDQAWFKVYQVGHGVYAIMEPYNYQEVISFLILGDHRALLFDTGMGLDSISPLVHQLTRLPILVLNSHTHYDHMGGNYEFDSIYACNTVYTLRNAAHGWSHQLVGQEASPALCCLKRLPHADTAGYWVRPFKISKTVVDGEIIDLGSRNLKIIAVPGHAPDAIALLDSASGYLWTGDSYYNGPIFLYSEGTDLAAYGKSIRKLSGLSAAIKVVFPAHNLPVAGPGELLEAYNGFEMIMKGLKKGKPDLDNAENFDFGKFSFLIGKSYLEVKR